MNKGLLENRNIYVTFISEKNYGFNLEIGFKRWYQHHLRISVRCRFIKVTF